MVAGSAAGRVGELNTLEQVGSQAHNQPSRFPLVMSGEGKEVI